MTSIDDLGLIEGVSLACKAVRELALLVDLWSSTVLIQFLDLK